MQTWYPEPRTIADPTPPQAATADPWSDRFLTASDVKALHREPVTATHRPTALPAAPRTHRTLKGDIDYMFERHPWVMATAGAIWLIVGLTVIGPDSAMTGL